MRRTAVHTVLQYTGFQPHYLVTVKKKLKN
jgi:hypothetical protein